MDIMKVKSELMKKLFSKKLSKWFKRYFGVDAYVELRDLEITVYDKTRIKVSLFLETENSIIPKLIGE